MAFNVSTNVQAIFLDSRIRPGTVFLPSTFTIPGRTLIFKDQFASFSTNALTLTTNNANQTIDSLITSTINRQALGWQTLIAGNNNRWFTVGGTVINTINASTVNTTVLSSVNISSANLFVSSLGIIDQTLRSTTQLYVQSSFLYYSFSNQSTIISGTRQSFGGLFTPISRPFLPNQIGNLAFWMDAADSNTIQGNPNVTRILDKSGTNRNATISPTINTPGIFTGSGVNVTNNNTLYVPINMPTVPYDFFIVGAPLSPNTNYRTFLRTQSLPGVHPILTDTGTNNVGMWNGASFQPFGSYTWTAGERAMFYVTATPGVVERASKNGDINLTTPTTASLSESQITCIGNSVLGSQPGGLINEIILYSTTLSTPQRQFVEGYLAWKWGLVGSLPASHPYKTTPPGSTSILLQFSNATIVGPWTVTGAGTSSLASNTGNSSSSPPGVTNYTVVIQLGGGTTARNLTIGGSVTLNFNSSSNLSFRWLKNGVDVFGYALITPGTTILSGTTTVRDADVIQIIFNCTEDSPPSTGTFASVTLTLS